MGTSSSTRRLLTARPFIIKMNYRIVVACGAVVMTPTLEQTACRALFLNSQPPT